MAITDNDPRLRAFQPRWPAQKGIDPSRALFDYDRETDTLTVSFSGLHEPSVIVPLEVGEPGYAFLRVDEETEVVLGLHIEDFLSWAVFRHPTWLIAAEAAGINEAELASIRRRIPPAQRQTAALDALLPVLTKLDPA